LPQRHRKQTTTMAIYDKSQIVAALNKKVDAFNNYVNVMNKEQFEAIP
jgi:hypothetical protein